jgi:chorismate synthase
VIHMAGNSFGKLFRVTTFGESHGNGIGVVIDGVRPNLEISKHDIQKELNRRRPGQSTFVTSRQETDKVEIVSGIICGKTLGTPVCLIVRNADTREVDYDNLRNIFRPGHADFTYFMKYGIYDHRGGGRASGRETIGRVAAGAIAKKILLENKIKIYAYTKSIGDVTANKFDFRQIDKNPFRCPDIGAAKKMEKIIRQVKTKGDSVGGIVEAVVKDCPAGLGEPVFDKLEADLAKALMSIPAVHGFEIGSGFSAAKMLGSEHNDEFFQEKRNKRIHMKTNNAGGILGGISTGDDIILRVAVKPPSSIKMRQATVDHTGKKHKIIIDGRHDPCICPRVVPVVEAMIALVLIDHLMRFQSINRIR